MYRSPASAIKSQRNFLLVSFFKRKKSHIFYV